MELKDILDYISRLGIRKEDQIAWITVAVLILAAWWLYTKARESHKQYYDDVRGQMRDLYSPALGLLQGRASQRIAEERFRSEFTQLLIQHRGLAADEQVWTAMNSWLSGVSNESHLLELLEPICQRVVRDHSRELWRMDPTVGNHAVSTVFWIAETGQAVLLLFVVLILFVGACALLITKPLLGIICLGLFLGLSFLFTYIVVKSSGRKKAGRRRH